MHNENLSTESGQYAVRIPSLLEIFWGKLANGRRRLAEWRKKGLLSKDKLREMRRRAMRLETLEPRLLLSARPRARRAHRHRRALSES